MNINLIRMFNVELASNEVENFTSVNLKSIPLGYVVHPDCCTADVAKFLKEEKKNVNATFYKTWTDVLSKAEKEIWVDQINHYASTYGTNFSNGNWFVPNCFPENVTMEKFKVILPATAEDVCVKIKTMLYSGIALKSDTINLFISFLKENSCFNSVDLDLVKNKEAQCILSVAMGKLPNDEFGLLRVLVYSATGSTMLIKSREVLNIIKNNSNKFVQKLSEKQIEKLSRIFYRYKPIFLAMKNKNNSKVINKIRRLAVKNHTPLKVGFWESYLVNEDLDRAKVEIEKINNFKKIVVLQSIKERLISKDITGKMFFIRNGKMFVRENYKSNINVKYLVDLYHLVEDSIVDSLRIKACTYAVDDGVNIAAPTSEKNFVGNFPLGTSVDMGTDHNVVGIYWRNEWGTRDFDLHYCDESGRHFGWNSSKKDGENILFSGDMTNAEPEATELFYVNGKAPNGYFTVNQYWGEPSSQLKLFIAKEDLKAKVSLLESRREDNPVMCNPNNIKFEAMIQIDGGQKNLAYACDNKIYLMDMISGSGRVTTTERSDIINKQMQIKAKSFINITELLEKAGFVRVEKDALLDLVNPSKDELIKLFA